MALQYLAEQLDVPTEAFDGYALNGRTAKRDRESIRARLGFRRITVEDSKTLTAWLRTKLSRRASRWLTLWTRNIRTVGLVSGFLL